MYTRYEKLFGTPETAATTLFALPTKYQKLLENGQELFTKRITNETVWAYDVEKALSWLDWLKEEVEQ